MKYMIMMYGSQADYSAMAGKGGPGAPVWTPEDFAAMGSFMEKFNQDLADRGELVETRALADPVHARRLRLVNNLPAVTDGPYAETEEVLAGWWVVECDGFDRATEIGAGLLRCPGPEGVGDAWVDVRPVMDSRDDIGL